ncbi:hypothetical protein JAAARDRAFT_367694 [Jaapia argillacea MUCL 33604]|uniref:U3 small nucleolar RNA-associated protein 13 C-terminal domain-containing protein n=1 Tax=Jaapia argillacea MUCL 33604 TaxID=933084 RepID=A0A067QAB8_9AGAM|nr:hypothetical protein JAAARDRAFT_367694 [Jaapia argillacea MUCL 33604]
MANLSRAKAKSAFKKAKCIAPLHTAGPVAATVDGSRLVTCVGEEAVLTEVNSGTEICRFSSDTESITTLCVSPSSKHLLVFTNSLSLRVYEIPSLSQPLSKPVYPIRTISRAHDSPVHVCRTDPTSTYLASGSADGVVKVWDFVRGYVTHVFKGHGGVVSALLFNYPRDPAAMVYDPKMQLITASVDTRIRIFDLSAAADAAKTGAGAKPEAVLEGHVSVPRGLDVSPDGRWLISGGRDAVVLVWDLAVTKSRSAKAKGKGKEKEVGPTLVKTIPILERVEAVGLLQDGQTVGSSSGSRNLRFYTAGEKGVVKVWDEGDGSVLFTLGKEIEKGDEELEEQRQIVNAIYLPLSSTLLTIHADQNILFHNLDSRTLSRQLIGFNDEVIDSTFLSSTSNDTHLALATNSSLIRVYNTSTLDTRLLEGHSEIVLCLDKSSDGKVLVSGSKDRSIRIWAPRSSDDDAGWGWGCVGICEGHAESVGAIALSRKQTEGGALEFMFSGSQDRTIKMWDVSDVPIAASEEGESTKCKSLYTQKAHDKDINSLDISPNDQLLASGSQDRTAKIFSITYSSSPTQKKGTIKLVATLTGHKRGVWSVKFSPSERVLASGSGDKTVRIWSLEDWSCLRTLEGHGGAVLRVGWLSGEGVGQVVSAGGDGLVKVWEGREEGCACTLDGHEDKVWALAISKDQKTVVSGAADSLVNFWEDCTEEQEVEKENKRAEMVLKEQDFLNYLSLHDYKSAISLALAMEQPGRLLSLFRELSSSDPVDSAPTVDQVIRTLSKKDLVKLMRYVRDWNTNARNAGVGQGVLYAVVRMWGVRELVEAFSVPAGGGEGEGEMKGKGRGEGLKELVEGLIPYTERHLARMERLVKESYVVDYVLGEMDGGIFEEDEEMDVGE